MNQEKIKVLTSILLQWTRRLEGSLSNDSDPANKALSRYFNKIYVIALNIPYNMKLSRHVNFAIEKKSGKNGESLKAGVFKMGNL